VSLIRESSGKPLDHESSSAWQEARGRQPDRINDSTIDRAAIKRSAHVQSR